MHVRDHKGTLLTWGLEVVDLTRMERGVALVKRIFSDGKVTIYYPHSRITVRRVLSSDLEVK